MPKVDLTTAYGPVQLYYELQRRGKPASNSSAPGIARPASSDALASDLASRSVNELDELDYEGRRCVRCFPASLICSLCSRTVSVEDGAAEQDLAIDSTDFSEAVSPLTTQAPADGLSSTACPEEELEDGLPEEKEDILGSLGLQARNDCDKILFICGLAARGRTEFFQHLVAHMSNLEGEDGEPLFTCW